MLIAFHFPPVAGSSGVQRALRFAQYLPEFGWEPTVLTVKPMAYPKVSEASERSIPDGCRVVRVPCVNAAVHLRVFGRYPGKLALPDRWASWAWLGTRTGVKLCREFSLDAIWSTYPIATAHKIGAAVATRTGLPWIADFRDPMVQPGYPPDPQQMQAFKKIESNVARHASRLVFTTPSARRTYEQRFEELDSSRFSVLENGYDESTFDGVAASTDTPGKPPFVLLHSGIVYPSERNPQALFEALATIKKSGLRKPGEFVIRFRAPVYTEMLEDLARQHDVADFIEIFPPVAYDQALKEMLASDGLLVLQADNCNEQIPAKLYEYLRAQRPILGLADPAGDTGKKLIEMGFEFVVPLESATQIKAALLGIVDSLVGKTAFAPKLNDVTAYSRHAQTGVLARLLDETIQAK